MTGQSMDILSLLRLVVRQWRVTVPAAVVSLVGVVAALQLSSPTYEATGSIVLLSPPEAPDVEAVPGSAPPSEVGQNPFARYGDLSVVADILARVMDSDSRRTEFEVQGVTDYEVAANRLSRGPVIEVTGEGPDSAAAIRSTEIVLTEVDAVLADLQRAEGADPKYYISTAPLEPPSTATAMYGSTVRAAIGALAVGALCTLGLALVAEALAQRRAARPATVASRVIPEAVSEGPGEHPSNGSSIGGRVAGNGGSPPDLRLALPEPTDHRTARQNSARPRTARQRTAQQASPSEAPVDDRRTLPTTDRSP